MSMDAQPSYRLVVPIEGRRRLAKLQKKSLLRDLQLLTPSGKHASHCKLNLGIEGRIGLAGAKKGNGTKALRMKEDSGHYIKRASSDKDRKYSSPIR